MAAGVPGPRIVSLTPQHAGLGVSSASAASVAALASAYSSKALGDSERELPGAQRRRSTGAGGVVGVRGERGERGERGWLFGADFAPRHHLNLVTMPSFFSTRLTVAG